MGMGQLRGAFVGVRVRQRRDLSIAYGLVCGSYMLVGLLYYFTAPSKATIADVRPPGGLGGAGGGRGRSRRLERLDHTRVVAMAG